MNRIFQSLLAALLAFAGTSLRASEPISLAPSSPWNLRYDEDKCRMIRMFGSGEHQLMLMLDQSGIEPYYTLSVAGNDVKQANGELMDVQFGEELPSERTFVKGQFEDKTPLVTMFGVNLAPVPPLDPQSESLDVEVEPLDAARQKAIESIGLSRGLDHPIVLQTGSLGEPLAALQKCAADLVTYLGVGDGSDAKFSRKPQPTGSPGAWLNSDDYPTEMLKENVGGIVRFRLTVDKTGTPTSCHITRSSRPQGFDDAVCLALLKRARFEPALDTSGKPVAAYWTSAARFETPGSPPPPRSRVRH
jgi:TonB family protein